MKFPVIALALTCLLCLSFEVSGQSVSTPTAKQQCSCGPDCQCGPACDCGFVQLKLDDSVSWKKFPDNDPDQVWLADANGQQLGAYRFSDKTYRPLNGTKWGPAQPCPVDPPSPQKLAALQPYHQPYSYQSYQSFSSGGCAGGSCGSAGGGCASGNCSGSSGGRAGLFGRRR